MEEAIAETQTIPDNLPEVPPPAVATLTSLTLLLQVVNDFDVEEEDVAIQDRDFNLEKIEKRVSSRGYRSGDRRKTRSRSRCRSKVEMLRFGSTR